MNWKKLCCAATIASGVASAQIWEFGVVGGLGYAPNLSVRQASATASAGLGHGAAVGVYGGEDTYRHFGGEVRYLYSFGNLEASSNGASVRFGRRTHTIAGDILIYPRPTESRVRPFLALGGGVEILDGTGRESAAQPLGQFVALTHTRETLAVGDVGAGFKIALSEHLRLRIEAHDYAGPSPKKVIAPAPGASIGSFMNEIVGTISLAFAWSGRIEAR
ncbi:MAG TPA: outer membrane beta-barrel protein [Bryobacteraceae bacterium]|jgi:hypothetical protein